MGSVRARRRFGGWLALGALALQLVLSFAHIHAEDFVAGQPGPTIVTSDTGGGADSGDRHGFGHDDCAICAAIHLAGTVVTPLPPAIALYEPRCLAELISTGPSASLRVARQAFQARAPPQA